MAKEDHLICITCPRGCNLQVLEKENEIQVTGHSCKRGVSYAKQEIQDPRRVLTALMRADGIQKPISVKTDHPVPKDMLMDCAKAIYQIHPSLPVHCGDILVRDILGTGSNIIATCDAE